MYGIRVQSTLLESFPRSNAHCLLLLRLTMRKSQDRKMLPIGLVETSQDVNANNINDLDESVNDPSASADIESISVGHISIEEHSPRFADTCMCRSSAVQSNIHDGPNRRVKTYRRRWLGIAQIALLNIIMSWNVCFKALGLHFNYCS